MLKILRNWLGGVLVILAIMILVGFAWAKKGLLVGFLAAGIIGIFIFAVFFIIDCTLFAALTTKKEVIAIIDLNKDRQQ